MWLVVIGEWRGRIGKRKKRKAHNPKSRDDLPTLAIRPAVLSCGVGTYDTRHPTGSYSTTIHFTIIQHSKPICGSTNRKQVCRVYEGPESCTHSFWIRMPTTSFAMCSPMQILKLESALCDGSLVRRPHTSAGMPILGNGITSSMTLRHVGRDVSRPRRNQAIIRRQRLSLIQRRRRL